LAFLRFAAAIFLPQARAADDPAFKIFIPELELERFLRGFDVELALLAFFRFLGTDVVCPIVLLM